MLENITIVVNECPDLCIFITFYSVIIISSMHILTVPIFLQCICVVSGEERNADKMINIISCDRPASGGSPVWHTHHSIIRQETGDLASCTFQEIIGLNLMTVCISSYPTTSTIPQQTKLMNRRWH